MESNDTTSLNWWLKDAFFSALASQFMRYCIVGGLSFVVDFLVLFLLTKFLGIHYLVSASIGFVLGLITNYLLCILWIFEHRLLSNSFVEFFIFTLVGLAGLALNNSLIYGLTEWINFHYLVSKVVAASIVLIFNFSLRRTFLFTRRNDEMSTQGVFN